MIETAETPRRTDSDERGRIGNYVVRKILSFPVMLTAMLSLLAFLTVLNRFNDTDTWWHLRMGQIIWTTHTIPTTDLFSYTTNHHAWVPHEWLAQLSLYAFYKVAGYQGMMLWLFLLAAALLALGYLLCSVYSGNTKTAFIGALTLWIFSTEGLSLRPQLLGYVLMVVELTLIEMGRTRSKGWFYALPLLFALWVNIHGSFSFGMIILAVELGCSFISGEWGLIVSRPLERRRRNVFATCGALSAGALFINPNGVHQIFYSVDMVFRQHVVLRTVSEWAPLTIDSDRGLAMFATLTAIALLVCIRRAYLRMDEATLLLLASFSALEHNRLVFAFGVVAAPVVARLIAPLWEGYNPRTDVPWINGVFIFCSVLIMWVWFPSTAKLTRVVADSNPSGAVGYIRQQHLSGPMLNAFDFGGYLIWALPEEPVFIDGRADVYEWTGVMSEMERWVTFQEDSNLLLDKYHVSFCLLEAGSTAARLLSRMPNWKQVYADRISVIFVRADPAATS